MTKTNTLSTLSSLLAILFLVGNSVSAFGQWQQLYSPKTLDVLVTKYQGAYLNLSTDGLYRTINQGDTWEALPVDIDGTHVFAINPFNNKWYKAFSNNLFESTDEGLNWTNLNPAPLAYNISSIKFSKDTVFIQANDNHRLLKKIGNNWQIILNSSDQFTSFCVKDSLLFVAGYSAGLARSKNYGQTWEQLFSNNGESCEISTKGDTLICFFQSPNKVYRSFDFGLTWSSANIPANVQFDHISIQDGFYWGTWGVPNQPYYSTDGLSDWQALPLPSDVGGGGNIFQNGDFILMASNLGALRSFNFGQTWELSDNAIGSSPGYDMSFLDGNVMISCFSYMQEGNNVWKTPFPKQCRSATVLWNNLYLSGTLTSNASIGMGQWQTTQSSIPGFNPVIVDGVLSCEYDDYIHQSLDNGATWQQTIVKRPTFSHLPIVGKGNRLWAAGANFDVAVFRYDTLGQNWPHDAIWETGANCSFFSFKDTIYLLTQAGTVQYSADAGQTVITANKPADFVSSGAAGRHLFVRDNFMVITTLQDKFYVSKDRGQSWAKLPDPPYGGVSFFTNTPTVGEHFLYSSTDKGIFAYPLDSVRLNKGIVFFDQNSNGTREPNEAGVAQIKIANTGSGEITFTDKQGNFGLTGNKKLDSLKVLELPAGFVANPNPVVFQDVNSPVLFALQPLSSFHDLSIQLTNAKPFRPGFETMLTGIVKNLGTSFEDAQVTLTLPPELEIISFNPGNATTLGDEITWDFNHLAPLDVFEFQVIVKTDNSTLAGAQFQIVGQTPFDTDVHPADNIYSLIETVVSSYDPNDKVVSPEKTSTPELSETPLTYTIRFQNTGTAATEFVLVQDTISPLLDISTLQIEASSHPVKVKFKENRLVEFIFAPLSLPPQSESELGSQGFVRFTVRAMPDLQIGEEITNTAFIYFDYNPAITTNTVKTEIKAVSIIAIEAMPIEIVPNPTNFSVMLNVPVSASASGVLFLYNQLGQQVLQQSTSGNSTILSCQHLAAGIYTVHLEIDGQMFIGKLMVKH